MKPAKRPPGEKPAATIRFQSRQIYELGKTIADLKAKAETSYAAQCRAEDRANLYENESQYLAGELTRARKQTDDLTRQLADSNLARAYLQGFYDRAPAGIVFAEATAGGRQGNPPSRPPGASACQEGGETYIPGLHQTTGREAWRHAAVHPVDPHRETSDRYAGGTSEEYEVGEAHDGAVRTP